MKRFLIFILFISIHSRIFAQAPTTCFEIQSILVDACGGSLEGENEMVRFIIGPSSLNTATLNVTWPNNVYLGICQNAQTAANVDSLNQTIVSCGHILEPAGGVLPAGASVLMVTSVNMNPSFNSFAGLTDTLYMIFQCAGNTQGHFKNYAAGAGPRTLEMDFGPLCSDTVTYIVDSLIDQSGNHAAQDGATVNFTYSGIDTYTNQGCQAPIVPLNASVQSNKDTICAGDTIQLFATINSGNYTSYFWTGGNGIYLTPTNLNSPYISNTSFTGADFLIFGIVGACGDTIFDSLTVYINNGGSISLTSSGPTTFCIGDSVTVTATGATNYLWSNGSTNASITLNVAGNYLVTGTGGCGSAKDSVQIVILNDNGIALSLSGPDTLCSGDSLTISVINGGTAFNWSNGSSTSAITVFSSGTYNVTVTGQCGLINLGHNVLVQALPSLTVTLSDSVLCMGQTATISASGGNNFIWSNGQTSASITVNAAGNYSVISGNLCGNDTAYVTVSGSLLNVAFTTDKDSGYAPLNVHFFNQSTTAVIFSWQFGDNVLSNDSNPQHTYLTGGIYQVLLIAEDANGCLDSAFHTIIVKEDSSSYDIPNVFSPNGDGFNQYFNAKGTGIKSIEGYIYNRWGTKIGHWNSVNEGWNGNSIGGKETAEGTYFYLITINFNSGETIKKQGHLTLIR